MSAQAQPAQALAPAPAPAVAHRRHAALRRSARWLAAAYLLALALIAFWPAPVDRGAHGTIASVLTGLHAHGVPGWVNYALVEFTANIALFLPVGLLGVVLLGSARWWMAVLAGFAASSLIELGQLVFLPARFATPLDVLANTIGAALGALLALTLLAAVTARSPASPSPSRLHRR
ncbi:VanZ family protein [Cryobacterium zongtaii]|uniref:VanZ family protein n=1 Tax=Cryobacterium zongtaii TaxID=1259217 RepID=A0A2S3Z9L0_9MICO|nr:VanZ family protein [Cryobacterium zongtaii]POH62230.1 VanZ family protein [Cryobacterium zongtaii]